MKLRVVLSLLLAVALAGCGEQATDDATTAAPDAHSMEGPEAVGFGAALAQIRGHHHVSLELYRSGDLKGALVHARHPVEEILASVASELTEHAPDMAMRLETALQDAIAAVESEEPEGAVAAAFDRAAAVSNEALAAAAGAEAETPAYRGSVVALLLSTAAHEYEEAVGPKGIRLADEYQDGYGFLLEARRLYDQIASAVREAAIEEAEEIEEAFEVLADALPDAQPPAEPVDVLEVESAAELIGHELEETVDAAPAKESNPTEIVAEIEELLDEIVETYASGDADAAAELSAEAYLENYEVIEAEVIDEAPEVNEELEPLLGADLRRQISQGAPVETIEDMVARAKELLADALKAITEH